VATYRYRPRDFLFDPAQFGHDLDARWRPVGGVLQTARQMAAYRQHRVAVAVRDLLQAQGRSARWLADMADSSPTKLRRKLTGDYPALPEELYAWVLVLDDDAALQADSTLEAALPPT